MNVAAVNQVSLSLAAGETYGLVGESGCGKSTLSRLILGFEKPDDGEIQFLGRNLFKVKNKEMKEIRRNMQIVFQDSVSSLNPRWRIKDSIAEPLRNFAGLSYREEQKRVAYLLDRVGLLPADGQKYPHQFSGGQQKRICIARAIAINPQFIVFDEAVSGLDMTIRKKILDLLSEIRQEMGSAYLFITHDMDVALYMSQKISVMKDGELVETVEGIKSLHEFNHPYAKLLVDSLPPLHPRDRKPYAPAKNTENDGQE